MGVDPRRVLVAHFSNLQKIYGVLDTIRFDATNVSKV